MNEVEEIQDVKINVEKKKKKVLIVTNLAFRL